MTSAPATRSRIAPPPNYRSRKMQLRLFTIVAACMAALYVATEWLNPWRAALQPRPAAPEQVADMLAAPPDAGNPPGVLTLADPFRGAVDDEAAFKSLSPVARTLADGWSAYYKHSSRDDHQLMAKALRRVESDRVAPVAAESWTKLLEGIDRFWEGYRARAIEALDGPEAEHAKWIAVLDEVAAAWQADRAAFVALGSAEGKLSPGDVERLRLWRLRWEQLALAAIEDDTLHRPEDTDAWFRLLDVLARTSTAELERQPAARVTYVQLHKEAETFRGKLVRISGRVMQAKRIAPMDNAYGIEEQYLLWIKPETGTSPVVVYVLALPVGFPPLDQPNIDGGYTKLREDVEITGYFFKRWAYAGQQGTYTAPLILAKEPRWMRSPQIARGGDLPSRATVLLWVLASALFGAGVAALAYYASRRQSPAIASMANSPAAQQELAASLKGAQAGPGVVEALRQLEERDRDPRS